MSDTDTVGFQRFNPLLAARYRAFTRFAGWLAFVVGASVLVGSATDSEWLNVGILDAHGMRANAALAFLLGGLSLVLHGLPASGWAPGGARVCAVAVLLIGAFSLAEYALGWRGVDEWLSAIDFSAHADRLHGRMPLVSAFVFSILGAALLLLDIRLRHFHPSQWLATIALFLALFPVLSYVFGANQDIGIETDFRIGLRSSTVFLVMAAGVLATHPGQGPMRLVARLSPAGQLLRRLLPLVVLVPPAIGGLRLLGQMAGLYETHFGVALSVWSSVVVLSVTVYWYGAVLGREEDRRYLEESRFRSLLEGAPDAILVVDDAGTIQLVNTQAEHMFGYHRAEMLGSNVEMLVPAELRAQHRTHRAEYAHAPSTRLMGQDAVELAAEGKNGRRFAIEISLSPIPLHNGRGAMAAIRDISARKLAEAALRIAEGRAQSTLDALRSPICVVDANGTIAACNRTWRETGAAAGAAPDAIGIGANYLDVCERVAGPEGESARAVAAGMRAVMAHQRDEFALEYPCPAPTEQRWFRVRVTRYAVGHEQWLVVAHENITTHRLQEQKILRLNRVYSVLSGINGVIVRVLERQQLFDEACRIAVEHGGFGAAWIDMMDISTREIRPCAQAGADSATVLESSRVMHLDRIDERGLIAHVFESGKRAFSNDFTRVEGVNTARLRSAIALGYRSGVILPLLQDGAVSATLTLLSRETDFFDEAELRLLDELAADISLALDHIAKRDYIEHVAFHDTLTGLPNTRLFTERLQQRIAYAGNGDLKLAVALFDLENFTWINETHGRACGDRVLREIAARLSAAVPTDCAVARVGADTFAVGGTCEGEAASAAVCSQLLSRIAEPLAFDDKEILLAAHAGIAVFPRDAHDAETLFEHAEAALRQAKASRQRCLHFAAEANALIAERRTLETDLGLGLTRGEFTLVYQPKIELASGAVIGAEALLRWQHPQRGVILPGDFIGIAEDCGLIVALGDWVLREVCAQQAAWIAAGVPVVPIMINVSPVQIAEGDLLARVERALATCALEARHIEIELTETTALHDSPASQATLAGLRKIGVLLSLDDFGTGYASLEQICRFPIDYVKIDQRFVAKVASSAESGAIVSAIIAMSHALHLSVVAEGVESEAQLMFLRNHGCDEMQGFYFSPPLPPASLEIMLRSEARASLPTPTIEQRATVLIVDDEQGIRSALTRVLRRDGYRILAASSGEEALDLLAAHRVQLVICDQRMPGMSGAEFLDAVKRLYPETIRFILSGYTDLATITDAVNRGAISKFLTKPWNDNELRAHVHEALRHARPLATGTIGDTIESA